MKKRGKGRSCIESVTTNTGTQLLMQAILEGEPGNLYYLDIKFYLLQPHYNLKEGTKKHPHPHPIFCLNRFRSLILFI